jgi:hypothetical protein
MKSTLAITILAVTLLISGAAGAIEIKASETQTGGTPLAMTQNSSAEATDDGAQGLSTLGALALGIIGLLWARRHIAEL